MNPVTHPIFSCDSVKEYLIVVRDTYLEQGESLRSINKRCGFSSASYLQALIAGDRKLSILAARNLAKNLNLGPKETEYLTLLAKAESSRLLNNERALARMRELKYYGTTKRVVEPDFFSHIVYQIIFELCAIDHLRIDGATVRRLTRINLDEEKIDEAIALCLRKGWIVRDGDRFRRGDLVFSSLDEVKEVRRIQEQENHLSFIEIGKHRLKDELERRHFRGLTIAIPSDKFSDICARIRDFFHSLNEEIEALQDKDALIRIQLMAYFLSREQETGM